MRNLIASILAAGCVFTSTLAQSPTDRAQARRQSQLGWELMRSERIEEAAKAFQSAIDADPSYEFAYYGLGRADMALKRYVAAVAALTRCRDLYESTQGKQFANAQDAQRRRQDRLTELDEMQRLLQTGPQTQATQQQMRQLNETRRMIQDAISRGNDVVLTGSAVPAWVSLSLGSAYFRTGNLADAERAYKASIDVDPKSGEAHQNLAVVYLETNRVAEAEASLTAAKKTGFKVNPALEQDIQDRKKRK